MTHPEWVEAQKRQGYEIKKIGTGFYMYKRKSRWDSNKKKAIKVTGEYIGVVTPDGIIPRRKKIDETKPVFSVEYGATAFINSIAGNILEMLAKHFDKRTAQKIWVVSMLRLISPCPFRRVEDHYQTSWMSKMLPGLALSKSSISNLIDLVGNNRPTCAAFMRDMMQPAPYLLIDGSRVTSKSEGILRALPGHNSDKKYLPQVNQIHIVTVLESGDSMPGFYRNVSGNTPDISAFELTLEDAGVEGGIILADNGFASSDNFDDLENPENKLQYIVPLKRNTNEVDLAAVEYEEYFTYHNRGVSAHVDDKGEYRICTFRDAFMYAKEFSDSVRRTEKTNATAMTRKNFDPVRDLHDVSAKTKKVEENFGVIVLRTNIFDKPASYVYQAYKIRWDIELLFKTLRNTCEQDTSYMQDDAGFEAWTFFAHITITVACRILAKLRELSLLKNWSLEGLLDHLSRIHAVTVANEWRIAETTKKTRELVSSLGYNMDLSQT
jgi:transposase